MVKVTKSMTENDIMKVWDGSVAGYTDALWRAECEAKSVAYRQQKVDKNREAEAKKLAEERELARKWEMQQETTKRYTEAQTANAKQVGGDHYKNMGVEPWDVVDTWPIEQQIGYHRGGVLKYTMRLGNKDERLQEAKKALHYAEKLVEVLEKEYGNV